MGDSPKWVKSKKRRKREKERKKERAKVGENNGQGMHGARKPPGPKFVWVVVKTPRILTTHLSVDPNSKYYFMHHALCTIMHHVLIADYACELYIIHYSSCIIHYAQTFRPLLRIVFGMQPCVKPNI